MFTEIKKHVITYFYVNIYIYIYIYIYMYLDIAPMETENLGMPEKMFRL
jgi:hypothetical protein